MLNVGIITQARMTSTRLPGKVLKLVKGKSLLQLHIDRLSESGFKVIVATTTNDTDQPIVELCQKNRIPYFRGSEDDVLSRFFGAASQEKLDVIVRVTSDCPLIDGKLIKKAVEQYIAEKQDWLYLSNGVERTYPRGFDFEVFSFAMLEEANKKADTKSEREHVTPYFYQNKHGKTKLLQIKRQSDLSRFRLTVDEVDDFKMVEKLILDFDCDKKGVDEICQVLQSHPELALINSHIEQKKV
jgi:spore coat polysaccharide biosynthesis protein SpsF